MCRPYSPSSFLAVAGDLDDVVVFDSPVAAIFSRLRIEDDKRSCRSSLSPSCFARGTNSQLTR